MTIDEAIKCLNLSDNWPQRVGNNDLREALKLGIEALKRVKDDRQNYRIPYSPEMLPGESN